MNFKLIFINLFIFSVYFISVLLIADDDGDDASDGDGDGDGGDDDDYDHHQHCHFSVFCLILSFFTGF